LEGAERTEGDPYGRDRPLIEMADAPQMRRLFRESASAHRPIGHATVSMRQCNTCARRSTLVKK
jgi:hypothetical protein